MPFDLSTRYAADTIEVVIHDPLDKSDTGARITIHSPRSSAARLARSRGTPLRFADGKTEATEEEIHANLLEQTIGVTADWAGFTVGAEPLLFTPENVRALYTDPRTEWIQVEVLEAYLDASRFFGTPRTP